MADSKPLSHGAQLALMKLASKNSIDPSQDMDGALGPYGKVLERHGFAKPGGKCMGYKLWESTESGKAEGLRLSRQTTVKL